MDIQCFPFHAIVKALGVKHIDYFSLDVEGVEENILQTIPLDKIYIDIFTIEYSMPGHEGDFEKGEKMRLNSEKLTRLRDFFKQTGLYKEIGILPWGTHDNKEKVEGKGHDVVFKRI